MKKNYQEPELLVRNYMLSVENVVMTSDPSTGPDVDLGDDSEYDIFG